MESLPPLEDNFVVFERGIKEEVEAGATVELISVGEPGSWDVEGWYMIVRRPDGRALLLLTTLNPKAKFIRTTKSIMRLLRPLPLRNINFPMTPMIHHHEDIWNYHHKANQHRRPMS
ncbi:hypothetical protein [uncultured Martelella sp.]|uniref:hypothetical protein n=1 Tax=uncultured Martelella sp. TaxID=392331 RepID=UPI0029C7AB25|nr:hypothetical protein [uncultured Martelella sp.]